MHRTGPGTKLIALAILGTALFPVTSPWILCATALVIASLYGPCGIPYRHAWAQFRMLFWFLAIICAIQAWVEGIEPAIAVVGRLMAVVWAACLVTFTTPFSEMSDALARALYPLRHIGVSPGKVSFAVTLVIRFIPTLYEMASEVRDAQRSRGLGKNPFALVVPLMVRIVRLADRVAESVDARGGIPDYSPQKRGR